MSDTSLDWILDMPDGYKKNISPELLEALECDRRLDAWLWENIWTPMIRNMADGLSNGQYSEENEIGVQR